ncbi:MAG: Tol-Pal system beta propeller repeat protein TolB [Nitrospinaceae bacterium]
MILWFGICQGAFAAQPNVRLEMEQETRQEVAIAVPEFVLKKNTQDKRGLHREARKILGNDLRLSELFTLVSPMVYEELERMERGQEKVDYWSWKQIGAQWLVKTEFTVSPKGDTFQIIFRLYDAVNERFLFGKRYTAGKNHLRRVVHRFADEVVLQLTGKRGVAETKIVFLVQEKDRNDPEKINKEIYIVDFDGWSQKKMTDDRTINLTPAWSPDGRWIVYTSYGANNPDLLMIDTAGKGFKKTVLRLPGLNAAPSWSPGGNKIALVLSKDQNSEIYVLENNRKLNRLTRHFNIDTSPTWSPDGEKIAFTSDRSGTGAPQIYIMDSRKGDGAGVKRISFGSSYNDNPAWSPDGDKIAYTSRVGRRFQIKIYNRNTQKTTTFTNDQGTNEQPSWSPDGRFLAYRHRENGETQIYIKRVGGKQARQLSFSGGGGTSPFWSPFFKK